MGEIKCLQSINFDLEILTFLCVLDREAVLQQRRVHVIQDGAVPEFGMFELLSGFAVSVSHLMDIYIKVYW
jgi:hypothetical protein